MLLQLRVVCLGFSERVVKLSFTFRGDLFEGRRFVEGREPIMDELKDPNFTDSSVRGATIGTDFYLAALLIDFFEDFGALSVVRVCPSHLL